jgi:NAD(P)-dependent dehydrogenase (short-subunit alcohol dehydrogenase family)
MRLRGKRVLITGGSRGIGRALTLGLAREGADVVLCYRQHESLAREVVQTVESLGRRALAVRADVARAGEVAALVRQAIAFLGGIDVLVNNAGMNTRRPFLEVPEEEFDRVLEVNLKGPFLVGQAVARHMVERGGGGCIINVSSISAERAYPDLSHYQCAKAGVFMLTRGMALELAPYNIRVNAIAPGLTATDINRVQRETQPEVWQRRVERIPLGRPGRPDDHVGAVVFLASDEAAWVTGATIVVDGGQSVQ